MTLVIVRKSARVRVVCEKCVRVLKSLPGYRKDSRLRRGRAFSRGNFMKRDHVWCGDFHEVFGMVSWDSRGKDVT